MARLKGICLEEVSGIEKRSNNPGDEEQSETDIDSQDIVDISKQFPMFSEEPHRLRDDLKQSNINSTSLRYNNVVVWKYADSVK